MLALATVTRYMVCVVADSSCQTPPEVQPAKTDEPGVIVGELHFAKRNEKGEWVRDPGRFRTEAKKVTKTDPGPRKQEPAKPDPKKEDKTDFDSQFADLVRSQLEIEAQIQEWACDYVSGTSEAAIWEFKRLPEKLADRDQVQFRLRYDLFPTIKGFDGLAQADITFTNRAKWDARRADEYRRLKENSPEKLAKPEALAREFGVFELKAVQLDANRKRPLVLTFPGSLLADLKNGTLEVRVKCRTQYVYAGFHADDLVILTRPVRASGR
jgi:hypothetical protein